MTTPRPSTRSPTALDVLEIEVRQDIAGEPAGQAAVAELLARLLPLTLERSAR